MRFNSCLTPLLAVLLLSPIARADVTFNKDIAPIVFKNCAACHRPDEVAPFSLLTYKDVRKHAREMVKVTSARQMPPWSPVAPPGTFVAERVLAADEIALLRAWLDAGAPEGDPKDLPPEPKFATGWQIGEPDMIVTMPKAYQLQAEGRDVFRNIVIPVEIPAGKYIRAVEYRPGNRKVVHHAILSIDASGKARTLDGQDGAPGFSGGGITGSMLPGSAGFWVPGKTPQPLPEGASFNWPRNGDLVLQLHLHPSGKPETEQSSFGLFFTNDPPKRQLTGLAFMNQKINIPPGEKAYPTRNEKRIDYDADVVGIFPHMHWIGKTAKITAVLPDGAVKELLRIDNWDFNWQGYYEYAKPISLPRGTNIVMEYTHDNSDENPANPNHPPRVVVGGEQTSNEMSALLVNLIRKGPAGGPIAQANPAMAGGPAAKPQTPQDFNEQAAAAIKKYDTNNDGKLDLAELQKIDANRAPQVPALLKQFDKDGDGKLNAAELAEAIAALKQR